jgi:Chaperone of endosialidase
MLICQMTFGQNNRTFNNILTGIPPGTPFVAPNEIFRFQPGNVTQLDLGTGFGFTADRWFSLGKVVTGANTAYGLRFQLPNKAVTFGYQSITNVNPRIEWIDTGANIGDLEFRSANSFTSTTSTLVATMKKNGNTIFGNPANISGFRSNAKVAIEFNGNTGLYILGNQPNTGLGVGEGIYVSQERPIQSNFAITAIASNGSDSNIAIYGIASGSSGNDFAGSFVGNVTATGSITQASDEKLKENMNAESTALEKISKLKPVTYKYKEIKQLNLPKEMQHGFVAQDIETIFPELVKDISQPVFDKEDKTTENYRYKAVN